MGFFDKVKSSSVRQEARPVNQIPPHLQQFDASAYIASNPVLKQQFAQPTVYNMPTGSPGQTFMQRPGSGGNSNGGIPTPNSTPPPAQPAIRPALDTNVAPVMPQQGQQPGQNQYSMVCSNSVTSPGVQDVYVVPFAQQQQQMQQHSRRHSYIPGQPQAAHMYTANTFPVQVQQSSLHYPQPMQAQTSIPALPQVTQVQQQSRPQTREPSPAARRYSIQTDRSSPPAAFPSQLPVQRMNSIKQPAKLYQLPEMQRQMTPSEPANQFIPRNMDARTSERDEVLTVLKPMNLSDYLTITGPEDITRHIPAIDRSEAAVSEYQHPDQQSLTGQAYPLMRKQTFNRPCEETFSKLLTWNGRRITPYPTQTLGRLIRGEEDVASLSDDFWLKPVHTATCAWLQAIDSVRYNGEYTKGSASRLVTTTSTSIDGIAENREDLDTAMLHFSKQFTLYPPVQNSVAVAKKEVVFFMEFVSPGVLTEAGSKIWEEGGAEALGREVENRIAHSYYSATRQVAMAAKTLRCRAGALCDYENLVLFYFKGQPDSFTGPESAAEVVHLKYTDPHARYIMAELVYRSMAESSERLNLGDLSKVVEANQQMNVKNFNLMWGSTSVVR
ncbi:hypothetical protein H072_10849 [Dactylellina haptotyla CBS 200.50]|uniref:Uncharacterized protein n=1 Tax=Dactylellina haptotyla (strain CBS 200.50) TaxID=1284197 RepID=S8A3H1_DACHA|nr:hypothetical protein H072_10849 [Dactylellina haptotyla CBS 200.50]